MVRGNDDFFGGMFDFNGDGQTDSVEAALGYQILDEMDRKTTKITIPTTINIHHRQIFAKIKILPFFVDCRPISRYTGNVILSKFAFTGDAYGVYQPTFGE